MTLEYALAILARLTMFTALVVSFLFCHKKNNPSYLRYFPIYHVVANLIEIIVDLFFSDALQTLSHVPYNLYTIFEFIFFSLFISNQLTKGVYKKIFYVCIGLVILLYGFLIKTHTLRYTFVVYSLPAVILYIVGCFMCFFNVFSEMQSNFKLNPAFWIISGILLYSITVIPTFVIDMDLNPHKIVIYFYMIVNSIGYIFLNLFFIKAYICRIIK